MTSSSRSSLDRLVVNVQALALDVSIDMIESGRRELIALGWAVSSGIVNRLSGSIPPTPNSPKIDFQLRTVWLPSGDLEFWLTAAMNGNAELRRSLGGAAGPVVVDGGKNVVGSIDSLPFDVAALLTIQLDGMAEQLLALLAIAAGGAQFDECSTSIQYIEVNRDVEQPDALRVAHLVQLSSPANAYFIEKSVFGSGWKGELDRGSATTWFYVAKGGPAAKNYAKWDNLIRAEMVLDRDALGHIAMQHWEILSHGALPALVGEVMAWCTEPLDQLEEHVRRIATGTATPTRLALALQPLLLAAAGERPPGPGRPPADDFAERCGDAYNELMLTSRVFMPGERRGSRIRNIMDALVASGVLQAASGKFTMYSVRPEWVSGMAAPLLLEAQA